MKSLYEISDKHKPLVTDEGTKYITTKICEKCSGTHTEIGKLGAFLPNCCHKIGLIRPIGGIIGSETAVNYLQVNNMSDFTLEEATVTFKCDSINEKFSWIKPVHIAELDIINGPGPGVVCEICNRRSWKEKELKLPRFKEEVSADLIQIKYTWVVLATERFMKLAKAVPDGCYLEFEPWYYE